MEKFTGIVHWMKINVTFIVHFCHSKYSIKLNTSLTCKNNVVVLSIKINVFLLSTKVNGVVLRTKSNDTMVLEIVNTAANVSSNLIGCFEVVQLAPTPTIFWDPQWSALFVSFFLGGVNTKRRLCLARSFCFASPCLFAFDFRQFFLSEVAWVKGP